MSKMKLLGPAAALAIGAVSMVGMYAFAASPASTTAPTPVQTQTVSQSGSSAQVDDRNTTVDAEVNDDNGSSQVSQQNDQNETQDAAQPGEVEDAN